MPRISAYIIAFNEAEKIEAAVSSVLWADEIVVADSGSTDATAKSVLAAKAQGMPEIRLIRHSVRSGQSAAVATGVRESRATLVATLDGDGQNDPADIPNLIDAMRAGGPRLRLVMGNRTTRRDTWLRRLSSRVANGVRGWFLQDGTPDTGCGIKLLHRATFLELPYFDHMHRFLPALFRRAGAVVVSVPVRHRPRARGVSKYGMFDRLWVGIVDILGVMWLQRRFRPGLSVSEEQGGGDGVG